MSNQKRYTIYCNKCGREIGEVEEEAYCIATCRDCTKEE